MVSLAVSKRVGTPETGGDLLGIMDFARVAFPERKVSSELREVFGYAGRPLSRETEIIEEVLEVARQLEKLADDARWVITQSEDDRMAMSAVLVRFELSEGSLSSRMDQLLKKIRDVTLLPVHMSW